MHLKELNLPDHALKIKRTDRGDMVWDPARIKFVRLTPEEYVRQRFVQFLVIDRQVPLSLLSVERKLTVNKLTKRADIVIAGRNGEPLVIIECKAPDVKIDQGTFDQAARYNLALKVPYLMVTNGSQHFCCSIDRLHGKVEFMDHIPSYVELTSADG